MSAGVISFPKAYATFNGEGGAIQKNSTFFVDYGPIAHGAFRKHRLRGMFLMP